MATQVYLDIDQGSDFSVEFTLQNDDGTPMNLISYSAYAQFRKSASSTQSHSFTVQIPTPSNGKIKLLLSGATSTEIKPGRYFYDVEIVSAATGARSRVIEGLLTLNAEITKTP